MAAASFARPYANVTSYSTAASSLYTAVQEGMSARGWSAIYSPRREKPSSSDGSVDGSSIIHVRTQDGLVVEEQLVS